MILSSGAISVMLFVDRMMLSWDSTESIAAALPAGVLNWALLCPFFGAALYTSTFVAQYLGAGRHQRVGAALWQGLRIALIGGAVMPMIAPFADDIFRAVGHSPAIQASETVYFRILNYCAVFFLANTVFSCFYSGRGRAWTILWANILQTVLNTVFDYLLIFGKGGFPQMGIAGAGWATMISAALTTALYAYLVLSRRHERDFATRSAWRFDKELFARMVRYGAPSGIHFFLDVIGFTFFILMIGRIGTLEQAATNITHQVHLLGLLPLTGVGVATSVLVGRYVGAGEPALAEKTAYSALQLAFLYNALVIAAVLLVPRLFIEPFLLGRVGSEPEALVAMCSRLLKYVAAFALFESVVILASSALKGAGDTAYIMKTLGFTSVLLVIAPTFIVIETLGLSVFAAWGILACNLAAVSAIFFLRFRGGKWKRMRVIEG